MKQKHIKRIIIACIAIIIVGAVAYVSVQPAPPAAAPIAQPAPQKDLPKQQTVAKPGSYVTYSETNLANAIEGRRILFFHASWCPQCRQLDKEITASTLPDGVTILKVDYDTSHELRVKYGVTLQTTIVEIDKEGNKITSFVAYSEPTYASLAKQLSF